jgi:Plasmid encoded RepA protein
MLHQRRLHSASPSWDSTVTLGEPFFEEIVRGPVPIDTRALRALTRLPLAIDLYVWLTYRMSYLKEPTMVPWELLSLQTGAHSQRCASSGAEPSRPCRR